MSRTTRRQEKIAMVNVRLGTARDAGALGLIMYDAIHAGHSAYNAAQRLAWIKTPPQGVAWGEKLRAQTVWVADGPDGPVGFITLAEQGYVDLAFVAAQAQGRGVFRALYRALEAAATAQAEPRLWTHASLMAQPAFERFGFRVIRHERIDRHGEILDRAEMEKILT